MPKLKKILVNLQDTLELKNESIKNTFALIKMPAIQIPSENKVFCL